jgi:hypothetical protein
MMKINGPGFFFRNNPNKRNNAVNLIRKGNLGTGYVLSTFSFVGKNGYKNYVFRSNNKIHGFAVVRENGNNLHIVTIGTTQKKGIGRLLMNRIRNDAKRNGFKNLRVNSIPSAMGFYKAMGFIITNSNNSNTFNMKKSLE